MYGSRVFKDVIKLKIKDDWIRDPKSNESVLIRGTLKMTPRGTENKTVRID